LHSAKKTAQAPWKRFECPLLSALSRPPNKVKEARQAEMSYYMKMGVYKKVPT
jgi:hypothetical protein